ncbi:hypothetical protein [Rhizocola hellebori]|uniref:hypothetical protein n=1 Tax=Rhizocola hellebori TaxID=1392758 RepID=UPI0019428CB2|nr:hypothetical protein [Rhizocola hellebori]
MKGEFRLARQTSSWAQFALVEVDVVPAGRDGMTLADDRTVAAVGQAATIAAWVALGTLPGSNHITIASILTSSVDTNCSDVFEATLKAVWCAYGMPDHDVSLRHPWLAEQVFAELRGRTLLGVTAGRYWFKGRLFGEVNIWLHFAYQAPIRLDVDPLGATMAMTRDAPYQTRAAGSSGELRVGPAQPPDPLATIVGGQLLSSTVLAAPTTPPDRYGAIMLSLTTGQVLIGVDGDRLVVHPCPTR